MSHVNSLSTYTADIINNKRSHAVLTHTIVQHIAKCSASRLEFKTNLQSVGANE